MKPNLPKDKVKCVLVDKNISYHAKNLLKSLDITIIETLETKSITDATSTHPDMQFALLDENTAAVNLAFESYYKSKLPGFNVISIPGIHSPYPDDSLMNFTVLDKNCFITDYQRKYFPDKYEFNYIKIKQGYSKCNICILNENAIITSDKGISSAALKNGIRTYLLPSDEITLSSYKNGFWGGCSGLISQSQLFFNGNIEKLACFNELCRIFEKEKIEPVYYKAGNLCDNGSIIPLF